jgi:PmbA protein
LTGDLLELATGMVERARGGEVEAFLTHEREFQVKAFEGEVESLSSAEPRGAGIRAFKDGRVGFAYTTDLSESGLDAILELARANAEHATVDEALGVAEAWNGSAPEDVPGLVDESQSSVAPDAKTAFAVELDRLTRAVDPRIRTVEEAVYADSDTEIAIATSTGIAGSYSRTDAWSYAFAIATEGDDTEVGFDFDLGRGITELDVAALAKSAAQRALSVLGASKIPSAKMPVIFDPYTAGQFLGVIGGALTGEAVQKGKSLFAGKEGQKVAAENVTLVDDGRAIGAPGSAPWDAEGVPTGRTELIRGGTLAGFLYDLTSARRDRKSSTGNAARAGFKSAPYPAPSNLAFDPTGETVRDIRNRADRALLVRDLHGVHSGANPISGDFSVGATGILLEKGEEIQPVKEITIAAPMLEILSWIEAVGDDRRWLPFGGSLGGATTFVSEMTVGGL